MNKTKRLLNKFDKEQEELSDKNDKELKYNKRVEKFLQYKFNEKYAYLLMLLAIPSAIILCFWIVDGNTFNDGFLRFVTGFLGIIIFTLNLKRYYFNKLKKEFAISEIDDE